MKERIFKFKKFSIKHERSAMKVGVDGVLIGAWTDPYGTDILDVGTGCGLISLMVAQRNPLARIVGIDIDKESVTEAEENIKASGWENRVEVKLISFLNFRKEMAEESDKKCRRKEISEDSDNNFQRNRVNECVSFISEINDRNREEEWCNSENNIRMKVKSERSRKFDLIISNPPFFNSGIIKPTTARESARHQGELSPGSLIREGKGLLKENGRISLIAPAEYFYELRDIISEEGLNVKRVCRVSDHPGAPFKRVMLEIINNKVKETDVIKEKLVMFEESGSPTEKYRELCKDFYLKF